MDGKQSSAVSLRKSDKTERKVDFMIKKLPPIENKEKINYGNMLLLSKEVEEREKVSREDAHQLFMKNYSTIFQHDAKPSSPSSLTEKPKRRSKPIDIKDESHEITEHLSKLHRHRVSPDKEARVEELIKKIRKVSKKPPYERSSKENRQLSKLLLNVACFSHIPKTVLEKLAATAHLEKWDPNFTIFGDSGLYLILKGSCLPNESQKMNESPVISRMESILSLDYPTDSQTFRRVSTLYSGDYFGKLETSSDYDSASIMSAITLEECEVLRFSMTSFQRVTKQIRDEEYQNKLHLAQSCKLFRNWPNLSLRKISEIFHWTEVPPGDTLGLEGAVATRICFIKQGVCQLRKILSVASVNQDGKKIQRRKEVVTGNLEPGDSFGEKSVVKNQPLEHSIISETHLVMAFIGMDDLEELDEVTKILFQQTCEATGSKTTKANIKKKYIEKQVELEWKSKKEGIVRDALYYNGIMPGYSKWSRNPMITDVQHLKDVK